MLCYDLREPQRLLHPLEATCRQRLAHCPAIQVVGIQVEDVTLRLGRVKALDQRVVSPRVALGYQGDTAAHPLLDEEVLVIVREQVELHPRLFEQSVP